MTPFMQFRLWLREGPASERVFATVVTLLAVALLSWAVIPAETGDDGTDVAASTGAVASESATTPDAGAAPEPSGPEVDRAASGATGVTPAARTAATATAPRTAAPGAAAQTPAASQCDNRATDQGVSAKEILIGVVVYTLGEANPLLGIPPAADTMKMYNTLFDHYNKQGGIQCRNLVAKFYDDFVLSSDSGRASCLAMQEDKVFAVMNNLFRPENRNCLPQAKIPNFWATSADTATVNQFLPYVLSFQADYDRLFRDYIHGAYQIGFFNGMVKLGVLEQTCYPDRVKAIRANLAQVGIGSDKISAYNFGCPGDVATPDQATAAALQFNRDGVTHVVSAYREGPSPFADAAEQQGYRPKYAFVDDQFSSLMSNANPPWSENLDGALIIEKSQEGAEYTSGATFTQATADCEAITKAAGLPSPTSTGTLEGSLHALGCIHTKMLVAAAAATKPLTRAGLAQGLATVGDLDMSFPAGPAHFQNPRFPIGAQFWRSSVYKHECTCVRLRDATWRPEFK